MLSSSAKYFAAALAIEGVISGLKTRVFPSRSKNLKRSLDGVVPISELNTSKNSKAGV